MKTCPRCNTQIPIQAAFCPNCGQGFSQPTPGVLGSDVVPVLRAILGLALALWSVFVLVAMGLSVMSSFAATSEGIRSAGYSALLSAWAFSWLAVAGPLFILWLMADRASRR